MMQEGVVHLLHGTVRLGTAFLIGDKLSLTAFHCIGDRLAREGRGRVNYPVITMRLPDATSLTAYVVDWDRSLDVAVLAVRDTVPQSVASVPLGDEVTAGSQYRAKGYPSEVLNPGREADWYSVAGYVTDPEGSIDGVPAMQMYSREAAAGLLQRGLSGAPILVGTPRRAVGIAIWNVGGMDQKAMGGSFYATPMSAILERWPDLRSYVLRAPLAESDGWYSGMLQRKASAFVGRGDEIAEVLRHIALERLLPTTIRSGAVSPKPRVCVLVGGGGSGKTAMAYQVATDLCPSPRSTVFRNGWLDADVQGYVAGDNEQDDAASVLRAWLTRIDVTPERNLHEASLTELKSLFDHALIGRELILIVDNVRDHASVREVIPDSPSCVVLITSRDRPIADEYSFASIVEVELSRLRADDAEALLLQGFSTEDSRDAAIVGAVANNQCAGLPLAIKIARGLAEENHWSLIKLNMSLRDEGPVKTLRVGDGPEQNLARNLLLSYKHLPEYEQEAFRFLATLPPAGFRAWMAAAFFGCRPIQAESLLEKFVQRSLLEQVIGSGTRDFQDAGPGALYRFHDLIRQLAVGLQRGPNMTEQRLLEAYERLGRALWSIGRYGVLRATAHQIVDPGAQPTEELDPDVRRIVDHDASRWLRLERPALLEVLRYLSEAPDQVAVLRLTLILAAVLELHPVESRNKAAHDAAIRAGLRAAEALAYEPAIGQLHLAIGRSLTIISDWPGAQEELVSALESFVGRADPLGEATARALLGDVLREQGFWEESTVQLEQAIPLFAAAHRVHEGCETLLKLGRVHRYLGAWAEATECFTRGLAGVHGDRSGLGRLVEGLAHLDLADILRDQGRLETALEHLNQGDEIFRDQDDDLRLARVASSYVDVYRDLRRWQDAEAAFDACDEVFRRYGDVRWSGRTRLNLAISYRYQRRFDRAEQEALVAQEQLAGISDPKGQAMCEESLGVIQLELARDSLERKSELLRSSESKLRHALEYFTTNKERLWTAKTTWALGRTLKELGWADVADQHREEAERICAELGAVSPRTYEPWHG